MTDLDPGDGHGWAEERAKTQPGTMADTQHLEYLQGVF